jgi:hypothetical protein
MRSLEQERSRLIKHKQTALKFRKLEVFTGTEIHTDITRLPKYLAYCILSSEMSVREGY